MTELNFKAKEFVYNHHLSVPFHPLVPHADKGIGKVAFDGNLIVQGDNLKALKALMPMYAGKVDCIFIDPPYNTGNEGWCYNDNVNSPMIKEWLEANPIGIDDGLRHDKWCAMMWPRLRLLHELLSDDGVIFVTIDDYEQHRMRNLLDDCFGPDNFVATIVDRLNPKGRHLGEHFAKTHEYIHVFAKIIEKLELRKIAKNEAMLSEYDQEDTDGQFRLLELRNRNSIFNPETRPNLYYPIYIDAANGLVSLERTEDFSEEALPHDSSNNPTCWTWNPDKFLKDKKLLCARKTRDGIWRVFRKDYLTDEDGGSGTTKPKSIWLEDDLNMDAARLTVRQVLGENAFDFPKPVPLVQRCIEMVKKTDATILDSFAGSGTTAHAVLEANKHDGGNRRFILVEMEDYADRLTAERVRRVINGYDFTGTKKTELLREKLNWKKIEQAADLVAKVQGIENLEGADFDNITKKIKDGELIVTGETKVAEHAEGLGGSFTYCTLGGPVEMDKILTGESLPAYDQLGALLFHMATNRPLDMAGIDQGANYLGQSEDRHVWLIYRDDLEWLKSQEAALTLSFARQIAKDKTDKPHLVFAPARFVSQKLLNEEHLQVEFAPLPFALYRIERD